MHFSVCTLMCFSLQKLSRSLFDVIFSLSIAALKYIMGFQNLSCIWLILLLTKQKPGKPCVQDPDVVGLVGPNVVSLSR